MNDIQNIFLAIDNGRSENMSSALLKYFLDNNEAFRNGFINMIQKKENKKINFTKCTFITEHPCTGKYGEGRVDLKIETPSHVIFIENKFFADFQENQPQKYIPQLKQDSEKSKRKNPIMLLLVPEARSKDSKNRLGLISNIKKGVIEWESVRDIIPDDNYLTHFFKDYIDMQINILRGIHKDELCNIIKDKKGNDSQSKILRFLKTLSEAYLSETQRYSGNITGGENFYGFQMINDNGKKVWVGFVNLNKNKSILCIKSEQPLPVNYNETIPKLPNWKWDKNAYTVKVNNEITQDSLRKTYSDLLGEMKGIINS